MLADGAKAACFLIGLALVCAGAGMVYPPAGVIVAGVALVLLSVAWVRSEPE